MSEKAQEKMSNEHVTSVERIDGVSRYGRPTRSYRAVCSCGWRHNWSTPVKHLAESDAKGHASEPDQPINRIT